MKLLPNAGTEACTENGIDNKELSMPDVSCSYRLKHFRSSRDPDFAAALLVYVRNTAACVRTDTNEITYWLDHFEEATGNPFYVFGVYRDRQLIGFAEAAYLVQERLIALDYVVVDEGHRRNNVFYEFVDQLKRYLERAHPEYRLGIAEVGYGPGQKHPSQENCLVIRLLKLQGFGVIQSVYYQPRLRVDDAESEMQGCLLAYSRPRIDSLRTETYLRIVHALYYSYYLPWKRLNPGAVTKYKEHLDRLYSWVEQSTGQRREIPVNGHKGLLAAPTRKPIMTVHRAVSFSLQALFVVILVMAAMLGLKSFFGLSGTAVAWIYGVAVVSFIAVAGIVSKPARDIFGEIVGRAKHGIRKGSLSPLPGGDPGPGRQLQVQRRKRAAGTQQEKT